MTIETTSLLSCDKSYQNDQLTCVSAANRSSYYSFSNSRTSIIRFIEPTSESKDMASISHIVDSSSFVYFIFFLVGVAMLLPWNVFITASDFFKFKFHGSRYEDTFQNFFSFASCLSGLIGLLYALATQKKASLYSRSLFWLLVIAASFVLMIISIQVDSLSPYFSFWISMILLIVGSFACSILSSDVFALAATTNSIYVQASLAGQGLAGLAVAIAQFGILYVGNMATGSQTGLSFLEKDAALKSQGLWYFFSALVTSVLAVIGFWYLPRLSHFSYSHFSSEEIYDTNYYSSQELLTDRWSLIKKLGCEQPKIILYMLLDFLITLSVFPGITSSVRSTLSSGFISTYFVSLGFIIFNLGDLLGRYMPTLFNINIASPKGLGHLSFGRLALLPIFLLSKLDLGLNIAPAFPPWLASDGLFFLAIGTLALTNGYLGTVLMMTAPLNTRNIEDRGMMASLMSLTLSVGLILGSLISFPFHAIACACNPF